MIIKVALSWGSTPQPRYSRIQSEEYCCRNYDCNEDGISSLQSIRFWKSSRQQIKKSQHDRQQECIHNLHADTQTYEVDT